MTEEQARQSFGRYLSLMRLEAGLELEHVSEETRISKHALRAIEEEDHAKLPEPVYVVGFIRSFADLVGADGQWAVSSYARSRSQYFQSQQSESEFSTGKRSFWPRFLLGAALVIVMAVAAYLVYSYFKRDVGAEAAVERSSIARSGAQRQETEETAGTAREKDAETAEAGIDTKRNLRAARAGDLKPEPLDAKAVSIEKKTSKYELKIEATEDAWIKIIVDRRKIDEYELRPGQEITVEADSQYNILVGNAGGVKLNLNGKPVHVPGKSGQMVNVDLP